jgi:hypothetical protein
MPTYCRRAAGGDRHRQQAQHGRIALVERRGHERRVAVEPEGQLGHVVRADREPVEELQELIREQAFDGSSHIMMTLRSFSPRRRPFSASSSTTAWPSRRCGRTAPSPARS